MSHCLRAMVAANSAVSAPTPATTAQLATGVHAAGYLLVTTVVAVLVFEKLGVAMLRKAWFNFDLLWAVALVATGSLTLLI